MLEAGDELDESVGGLLLEELTGIGDRRHGAQQSPRLQMAGNGSEPTDDWARFGLGRATGSQQRTARYTIFEVERMCIRRTAAVVVVALSLVLGGIRQADGVVGGTADGDNHDYVGALLGPLGVPFCSGVLVASSRGAVLLTTAHCLGPAGEGEQVTVGFGPTAGSGLKATGTFHIMAGYDPATGRNDVALVAFAFPPPIRPAQLGTAVPPAGTAVTTVGYGEPSRGVRTYATEIVVGSDPTWLYLKPGSGNSCDFDSGGPDLLGAVAGPTVVALTDRGTCDSDQDYLVTGQAVHDFVSWPHLDDPVIPEPSG